MESYNFVEAELDIENIIYHAIKFSRNGGREKFASRTIPVSLHAQAGLRRGMSKRGKSDAPNKLGRNFVLPRRAKNDRDDGHPMAFARRASSPVVVSGSAVTSCR